MRGRYASTNLMGVNARGSTGKTDRRTPSSGNTSFAVNVALVDATGPSSVVTKRLRPACFVTHTIAYRSGVATVTSEGLATRTRTEDGNGSFGRSGVHARSATAAIAARFIGTPRTEGDRNCHRRSAASEDR